jgi:hypothetical protein
MVAAQLPSPLDLPEERAVKLYYGPKVPSSLPADTQALFPLVRSCATETVCAHGTNWSLLCASAMAVPYTWRCFSCVAGAWWRYVGDIVNLLSIARLKCLVLGPCLFKYLLLFIGLGFMNNWLRTYSPKDKRHR